VTATPSSTTEDRLWVWVARNLIAPDRPTGSTRSDVIDSRCADLRAQGWTDETTEALGDLVDWACQHTTRMAIWANAWGLSPTVVAERVGGHLVSSWSLLTVQDTVTPTAALRWLGVCVAATSPAAFDEAWRLLARASERDLATFEQWLSVGSMGPLAYAAGLTPVEARSEAALMGVDRLATLAVLRGYLLPPAVLSV
jgi:hypothetical protein